MTALLLTTEGLRVKMVLARDGLTMMLWVEPAMLMPKTPSWVADLWDGQLVQLDIKWTKVDVSEREVAPASFLCNLGKGDIYLAACSFSGKKASQRA